MTEDKLSPPGLPPSTSLDKLKAALKEHDYTRSIRLYQKLLAEGHDQKVLERFINTTKKENPPPWSKWRKNRRD